jgi:hypothetical protein
MVLTYGLAEARREADAVHKRFSKKVGLSRCAVNGMAEMELERESRRGKVIWLGVKSWQQIMHIDIQDMVRQCYEWQKCDLRFKSWAKKMKEELESIGLV